MNEMKTMLRWMNNHLNLHPVALGAYIHHFFITIHPFIDGNGRTGRLLLNFMLMKAGYPPICIRLKEKLKYIDFLEKARDGNVEPFQKFIVKKVEEAYGDLVKDVS